MIKAGLKHASVNDQLVFHAWLVLMVVSIHFSFLMLILISF